MKAPIMGDFCEHEASCGLNEKLEPFVTTRAVGTAQGRTVILLGQLTPADARQLGLAMLEAAEAAEHDAIVAQEFQSIDMPFDSILAFISSLRKRRTS